MRLLAIATGLAIALSSTAANALTFTTTLGPTSTEPGAILFNDFDGTQNAGVGTFVGNCNCGQQPNVGNYFGVQNTGSLTLLNPVGYLGFLWGTTDFTMTFWSTAARRGPRFLGRSVEHPVAPTLPSLRVRLRSISTCLPVPAR